MQAIYSTTGSLQTFMTHPLDTIFNIVLPKGASVDLEAAKASLREEFKKAKSVIVPVGHIEDELNRLIEEDADKKVKIFAAEVEHNNTKVIEDENVIHIHCSIKLHIAKDVAQEDLELCLSELASDTMPLIESPKALKAIIGTIKGSNIPLEQVDLWLYPTN